MRRIRGAALAAGTLAVGAAGLARPALDALVARTEGRMNAVGPGLDGPLPAPSEAALALHATLRIADLHADSLLWGRDLARRGARGHVDLPRMRDGNIALQVFAMPVKTPRHLNIDRNTGDSDDITLIALAKRWPPATWGSLTARVLHLAGQLHRLEDRAKGSFRVIEDRDDLAAFLAARTLDPTLTAGMLAIEGAHALDDDPANVDVVADMGVRMISPAHFFDTVFGGSAHGELQHGLTDRGREMLARMEARGVIMDVAHASARTIDDVLVAAARPVVASHTGVRGVCDNARNLSDDQLRGIAATGGLVGIGFWETAAGGVEPSWIARSIAHAVAVVGVEHVALGSDWDGAVGVPFDAAGMAHLTQALLDVGLDAAAIRAVMGENALRFLAAALP